jgi:uncharacterized protein YbaR (Trm112 family)
MPGVPAWLLEVAVCPEDSGRLLPVPDGAACATCDRSYGLDGGVLSLLPDELRTGAQGADRELPRRPHRPHPAPRGRSRERDLIGPIRSRLPARPLVIEMGAGRQPDDGGPVAAVGGRPAVRGHGHVPPGSRGGPAKAGGIRGGIGSVRRGRLAVPRRHRRRRAGPRRAAPPPGLASGARPGLPDGPAGRLPPAARGGRRAPGDGAASRTGSSTRRG